MRRRLHHRDRALRPRPHQAGSHRYRWSGRILVMLRVVGAGLGRTGINSLKVALERLLGGRCYHMYELIERPGDTEHWGRAAGGATVVGRGVQGGELDARVLPAQLFWGAR